jgi:transposase
MAEAHSRHDISDQTWELLRPCLKGRKDTWGGNALDNRNSSTRPSGSCGREHLGATSRPATATRRTRTAGSAAGGTPCMSGASSCGLKPIDDTS